MKARLGAVAALAWGVAVVAGARQPDVDGMKTWVLPEYQIHAAATSEARVMAERLPLVKQALTQILRKDASHTGVPTHIYIAPLPVWQRYLQPSDNIASDYLPGRFADYLVFSAVYQGPDARQAVAHEYTHYFLRSQFGGEYPLWFDEGMAQLLQFAVFGDPVLRYGLPSRGYRYVYEWVPIDRLLRVDKRSPEYLSEHNSAFHRQAWALVHKAMIGDPQFRPKMFAYLAQLNEGLSIDDAVQAGFGMSPEQLNAEIRSYTRNKSIPIGKLDLEPTPKVRLGAGQRMSELENLELLARIMLDTGLHTAQVGEVIAAARRIAPDSASVRVLDLRHAARVGNNRELEAKWQAVLPQTQDPVVARAAGVALVGGFLDQITGESRPSVTLKQQAQRAYGLLAAGEHALPVDAEATWNFALLSVFLDQDPAFALQRLQLASAVVPRNGDLSMAAVLLHERLGQKDQMRAQLELTMHYARTVGQRLWAKRRLEAFTTAGSNP